MQHRAKLTEEINALRSKYNREMKGRMVPSPRAVAIRKQIEDLKAQINALDKDAAERLALENAPIDDVLEVIAIPLLPDVLNDIVAGVNATLRRAGVQETVFSLYTAQISKAALAIVDTLEHSEAHLPRLLDVDDYLIDSIKKKLMSFIRQRLNITKS